VTKCQSARIFTFLNLQLLEFKSNFLILGQEKVDLGGLLIEPDLWLLNEAVEGGTNKTAGAAAILMRQAELANVEDLTVMRHGVGCASGLVVFQMFQDSRHHMHHHSPSLGALIPDHDMYINLGAHVFSSLFLGLWRSLQKTVCRNSRLDQTGSMPLKSGLYTMAC